MLATARLQARWGEQGLDRPGLWEGRQLQEEGEQLGWGGRSPAFSRRPTASPYVGSEPPTSPETIPEDSDCSLGSWDPGQADGGELSLLPPFFPTCALAPVPAQQSAATPKHRLASSPWPLGPWRKPEPRKPPPKAASPSSLIHALQALVHPCTPGFCAHCWRPACPCPGSKASSPGSTCRPPSLCPCCLPR